MLIPIEIHEFSNYFSNYPGTTYIEEPVPQQIVENSVDQPSIQILDPQKKLSSDFIKLTPISVDFVLQKFNLVQENLKLFHDFKRIENPDDRIFVHRKFEEISVLLKEIEQPLKTLVDHYINRMHSQTSGQTSAAAGIDAHTGHFFKDTLQKLQKIYAEIEEKIARITPPSQQQSIESQPVDSMYNVLKKMLTSAATLVFGTIVLLNITGIVMGMAIPVAIVSSGICLMMTMPFFGILISQLLEACDIPIDFQSEDEPEKQKDDFRNVLLNMKALHADLENVQKSTAAISIGYINYS